MKLFYDAWYRFGSPPWVGATRTELVELVEDGTLRPGRAIDLGCGVGDNAIFLARHGFEVTAIDYGTLDDLGYGGRDAYVREVVPLARPGSRFLLWCFEWKLSRNERFLTSVLPFGKLALAPGEVDRRFGSWFDVERVAGANDPRSWPRGWAAYLTHRRLDDEHEVLP